MLPSTAPLTLSRQDLKQCLNRLGELCCEEGVYAEIALYGGTALMTQFDYRQSTRDIDFIPIKGAGKLIRQLGEQAAKDCNLHDPDLHLFSDDVQDFESDAAAFVTKYRLEGDYPLPVSNKQQGGHLRVFMATPHYLLAMKILSLRSSMVSNDCRDVWELLDVCKITSVEDATRLVEGFYPDQRIPKRNALILAEIMENKMAGAAYSAAYGY